MFVKFAFITSEEDYRGVNIKTKRGIERGERVSEREIERERQTETEREQRQRVCDGQETESCSFRYLRHLMIFKTRDGHGNGGNTSAHLAHLNRIEVEVTLTIVFRHIHIHAGL